MTPHKPVRRLWHGDCEPCHFLPLTRNHLLTYTPRMVVTPDRTPDVFAAISHPARRRMLDLLADADRSVTALAGHFDMTRPAVSQHLRVLRDAGLVTERRHGRERRMSGPDELSAANPSSRKLANYTRLYKNPCINGYSRV